MSIDLARLIADRLGMDWLQFISSLIGSLAWPAVVAYLLYLLREQLGSLADRLTELTLPGGTKASFGAQLDAARTETLTLAARNENAVVSSTEQPDDFRASVDTLNSEILRPSPRQYIMDKFIEVNKHIKDKIQEAPLHLRQEPYDFVFNVLYLQDGEKELYDVFIRLRQISSSAYNSSEAKVTQADAKSFNDICSVFLASFDKAFDVWLAKL